MDNLPLHFGKVPRGRQVLKRDSDQESNNGSEDDISKPSPAEAEFVEPEFPGFQQPIATTSSAQDRKEQEIKRGSSDDEKDESPEDSDNQDPLPVSHLVELSEHTKMITAISIDPSGARIASGSADYDVKLWDFGGMNRTFKPFKSFEPVEAHPIRDIAYSNSGDSFLVITSEPLPRLFSRDGQETAEFIKGDMYLRDLHHTVGHVSEIYACAWDPSKSNTFMTCSADSTIRIWDSKDRFKSTAVIVVKSKERGTRTKVTACAYSNDGKFIAAACLDGALHIYSTSGNFARPNATAEVAHVKNTFISGVTFTADGSKIVTRSCDGTVKVWDKKKIKKPIATYSLPCAHEQTNVIMSPDGKYILTGTSERTSDGQGYISVLELINDTLVEVRKITVSSSAVVKVLWHSKINQLIVGSASGAVHVLYSPTSSIRGALLCVSRSTRRRNVEDVLQTTNLETIIQTPGNQENYADDSLTGQKRKRGKEISDAAKALKPMPPINGPGRGGRVGSSADQYVVEGLMRDSKSLGMDPREALLKYATEEEKNSVWSEKWGKIVPRDATNSKKEESK